MKKEKLNEEIKKNKEEEELIYIKHYSFQNISEYKTFFREYRALKMIKNKSDYLIQLKNIKFQNKDNKTEIDLIFPNEGIDLSSLINANNYDYRNNKHLIKWILFQILKGIEVLHSLNIIHRNIYPKHILISSIGKITLSGFGNSINDNESEIVEDKNVGELAYFPPECLVGLNCNHKIDIWCVGVLMLELYYKKNKLFLYKENIRDEDYNKIFFKQLKYLSNFFGINYDFNCNCNCKEKNNTKEYLISWLKNIKFDKKYFIKKFNDIKDLDDNALDLLRKLLAFNPEERISANDALKSEYFKEFQEINYEDYNLPKFLKNIENEFRKIGELSDDKIIKILNNKLIKICKNESNL